MLIKNKLSYFGADCSYIKEAVSIKTKKDSYNAFTVSFHLCNDLHRLNHCPEVGCRKLEKRQDLSKKTAKSDLTKKALSSSNRPLITIQIIAVLVVAPAK